MTYIEDRAFFILRNTQSGKMQAIVNSVNEWANQTDVRVISFFITMNDKTLTDQSANEFKKHTNMKPFILSSAYNVQLSDLRRYFHAYVDDSSVTHPVVCALSNEKQFPRVLELITYIRDNFENSRVKVAVIFDEADKVYPRLRDVEYDNVTIVDLMDDDSLFHRIGWVTATETQLNQFEECQKSLIFQPEDHDSSLDNYRAIHHTDTEIRPISYSKKIKNNDICKDLLQNNKDYFHETVTDNGGQTQYRKIIVNANSKVRQMASLANFCVNDMGMYAMTFNGEGVTLYTDRNRRKYSAYGQRLSELLFYIVESNRLNDKPLIIIGRLKIDRGLGFHYVPREDFTFNYKGDAFYFTTDKGLIWSDMILGHVANIDTATQKAGRLAGIIAHSPRYTGKCTYWIEELMAARICRHNNIVDEIKTDEYKGDTLETAIDKATELMNDKYGELLDPREKMEQEIEERFTWSKRPDGTAGYEEFETADELETRKREINSRAQKFRKPDTNANGFAIMIAVGTHKVKHTREILDTVQKVSSNLPLSGQRLLAMKEGETTMRAYVFYEDGETDPNKQKYALRWLKCVHEQTIKKLD
jgi:hypothetical protein